MDAFIPVLTVAGIAIAAIILLIIIFKSFWKVAGTNEVLIVSGLGKVKTKAGGGIFVLPILPYPSLEPFSDELLYCQNQ